MVHMLAQEGEPSHELYYQERQSLLESLKRRVGMLEEALGQMEGVTMVRPEGALYAMPRIRLPRKARQVHLTCTCTALGWHSSIRKML